MRFAIHTVILSKGKEIIDTGHRFKAWCRNKRKPSMREGQKTTTKNLTILLPGGRVPWKVLGRVSELAAAKGYGVYLTTIQNLRLTGIPEEELADVKRQLQAAGADIKGPGRFPKPRVCVGKPHCNLALIDTERLSERIWQRFGDRTEVKPKFKIAIAACPASCSNALLADIGVVATRGGFDIYCGGKGGTRPRVGVRIVRGADEEKVIEVIGELAAFHDRKTGQKQRMYKLLEDPEFPFKVEGKAA